MLTVGVTYDLEIINGLGYLLEQGLISEGGKIGHLYTESEYGLNALAGVEAFAAEHGNLDFSAIIKTAQASGQGGS